MIKTDIDIKDDVYEHIKRSKLNQTVSGKLSKTKRPANSNKEDIVISILENGSGQYQEAYVNVNIYVKDLSRNNQSEENSKRLRDLCKIADEVLSVFHGETFRCTLDKQRVLEVNGKDEHVINNRLFYQQINE